ncbi:MAG: SAM-dependent methyltransferase [Ruminococcaceae bacterium]|nr:SAM-dependent methyltransferase [Oscillospiraceae bacterium]
MNTSQKHKIAMVLSSFNSKFEEGFDFFDSIAVVLVSGKKEYKASIVAKSQTELDYIFLVKKSFNNLAGALEALTDDIIKYDSAVVSYIERGSATDVIIDDRNVKVSKRKLNDEVTDTRMLRNKEYIINPSNAAPLLKALGYMTEDGKIRNDMIRKYNQTERFIELTEDMFDDMSGKNINIVDCACGKSYLSFVLNYYLWEVRHIKAKFTGLDISEKVIEESKKTAEKLGYKNMDFIQVDLRDYDSDFKPDTVISLHACDVATDMALGYAIRNGAKRIICIPCCHKELLDKYQKDDLNCIIKHGIFRARLNDILTDGIRVAKLEACGYEVSCIEYCSPLDTPKNLMIRAVKKSDGNREAQKAYDELLRMLKVLPSVEIYSMLGSSEY